MIASALAAALLLQSAGGSVEAVYPDDPTSWTLAYPVKIEPYVAGYYDCLRAGSYVIGDGTGFAAQYRGDIPRCAARRAELEGEAKAALVGDDEKVGPIFDRAERIHVARGQSLDLAIRTRLATRPEYDAVRDRVAVTVPGEAPRCIARLEGLVEQRRGYMDAQQLRIETIHSQTDFTPQDQQELARYQNQLQRYNSLILLEQRRCPEAGEKEIARFDHDKAHAQD